MSRPILVTLLFSWGIVSGCADRAEPPRPSQSQAEPPVSEGPVLPPPPLPDTARHSPYVADRPDDCSVPPPMDGVPTAYSRPFAEENGFGKGEGMSFRMGELVYTGFGPPGPGGVSPARYSVVLWALEDGCGLWVRRAEELTLGYRGPVEQVPPEFVLLSPQSPGHVYVLPDAWGDRALELRAISPVYFQVTTQKVVELISED